jgi:periplasmic protein TonB
VAHAQTMSPAPVQRRTVAAPVAAEPARFVLGVDSLARPRSVTLTVSALVHGLLVLLVVAVPLFFGETLPEPSSALRAFFVTPPDVAPPPPPPPPPAPAAHSRAVPPSTPPVVPETTFTAPVEIPAAPPRPEEGLAFGVEGGVPGGVEGGVPGGVVGGIVGGLPSEAPAPVEAKRVVRVGGNIHPPALIERVTPVYPDVAIQARLKAMVILEARVGEDGRVKGVKVLRGQLLFDQAAVDAVKQWRYRPLLLNGQPTEFDVTITVTFNLQQTSAS